MAPVAAQLGRVGAVLACVAVATSTIARAEDAGTDVEAIIRQGVALRKEGKDREALVEFRRAAAVQRTPHAVAQMGLAEGALGIWVDAEADLQEALRATDNSWIRKNRSVLDETLKTIDQHLGSVFVWGTPEGAEVLINGRVVGTLPTTKPVRVPVGDARLAVRAKGYLDGGRPIEVRAADRTSEEIELVAVTTAPPAALSLAAAPPAPPAATPAVSVKTSLEAEPAPAETPEEPSASPVYKRWWFWTAVGVLVAGGVTTALVLGRDKQTCQGTCTTWGGGS
jgi:hypothetical protein